MIVYKNHLALKYLTSRKDAKSRLIHLILLLQEFDLEIRYRKGSKNIVADHLSHLKSPELDPIDEINEVYPDDLLL